MIFNISCVNKMLDTIFSNSSGASLARYSVVFGVCTSCFLIFIKWIAWLVTDSISMQASLSDSILDALSSFLAYHALKFSAVKYDSNHNFGHEKVEGIMALFQCLVVVYSGILIFKEAYESFIEPASINNSGVGVAVMIISCVAVYQLIYFQRYVAIKTECLLVKGDSLHYLADFFMNICIMLSLVFSGYFVYIDAICGLIVGCYVLYNALLIIRNALVDLMDESLPKDVRGNIEKAICSVDGVEKIVILRTRSAGMKKYIDAKIAVNSDLKLTEANNIASDVENKIQNMFETVDVMIKVEPNN